jgi:hypothetical protein
MIAPRCFSQFSAGSRSLGAHLAIYGGVHCVGRGVYRFSVLYYLLLEVLEVLEPLMSKGFSLG